MYSFPPLAAAIGALYTVVTGLTAVFTPLLGSTGPVAAIVALTVIIRILLIPLGLAQARAEHGRAALAPKLRKIQERYRGNPDRLRREMADLYRREGTNPFAGCLPMLAQAPVFMMLYGLFVSAEIGGLPNELLAGTLGGVQLGTSLADVGTLGSATLAAFAVFGVLFVLLAAVAFVVRLLMPKPDAAMPASSVIRALPFGVVVLAAFVPLAAGVYLLTTTAWTAGERPLLRRLTTP